MLRPILLAAALAQLAVGGWPLLSLEMTVRTAEYRQLLQDAPGLAPLAAQGLEAMAGFGLAWAGLWWSLALLSFALAVVLGRQEALQDLPRRPPYHRREPVLD